MKLNKVKDIFNLFISVKPVDQKYYGLVLHPIFQSKWTFEQGEDLVEIDVIKDFDRAIRPYKELALKQTRLCGLTQLLRSQYRINFLELVEDLLEVEYSKEDFSLALYDAFTSSEFPNYQYKQSLLRRLWKKANCSELMDPDEIEVLKSLPDEIEVYRGFFSNKYYKAMSWTLDYEVAKWFANRFGNKKGVVYKSKIRKEDIYCYKEVEKEVILDSYKLKEVELCI